MKCRLLLAVTDCGVVSELPAIPLCDVLSELADFAELSGNGEASAAIYSASLAFDAVGSELFLVRVGDAYGY